MNGYYRTKKEKLIYFLICLFTGILILYSNQRGEFRDKVINLNNEILNCLNYNVDMSNEYDTVANMFAIESITLSDTLVTNDEIASQRKIVLDLYSREYAILNPYPIFTKENSLDKAYAVADMGIMYFANTNVHLYYSSSQSVIDTYNSAGVLTSEFGSDPIGVPGGCSIIGDHNHQAGKYFGNLGIGSKIYIQTSYGQFLYQVYKVSYGYTTGPEIYTNDGIGMVATAKSKQLNGIILYTCYPFTATATNQRYLVFAKLIDGTELL